MSDSLHLIVPCAVPPQGADARLPPPTPNLRALLAAMAPAGRIECDEDSPATPFELALAQAHGLPGEPGRIPWAAFDTGTAGIPCAWVKLCHWQVGADNVTLSPPEDLGLDAHTSSELLAAMAPYFMEDGIALRAHGAMPGVWLATGEPLRDLRTVSLDRLTQRRLTPAVLDAAASLRRLQNEMQMLLYTHPANDARQRQGLPPVNSFWIAGAGVLDHPVPVSPEVTVESRLVLPARRHDAAAHAQAWREADADSCARLLALLRAGGPARLTLCGGKAAQSFATAQGGLWSRFRSVLGLQPAWDRREQL